MKVKIAVTVADAGMAVNLGGQVDIRTAIIELTDEQVPRILRQHIEAQKRISEGARREYLYQTVSLSLVDEVG